MDATAERLLRESIEKHKLKRNSKEEARRGIGRDECPLCGEYLRSIYGHCEGCPVEDALGDGAICPCLRSPYKALLAAWGEFINPDCGDTWYQHDSNQAAAWRAYQKAEDAEIAFLESLLPAK